MNEGQKAAFVITPDDSLAGELFGELRKRRIGFHFPAAPSVSEAVGRLAPAVPGVILLDEEAIGKRSLISATRELATLAPVIVLVGVDRQPELGGLVAKGRVDVVARVGGYLLLVTSLLERQLRFPKEASSGDAGLAGEFAEILRHEINNPLTGILGNAELLLARPDNLLPTEVRRLETIADLAVRLRETVRKLTEAECPDLRTLRHAYSVARSRTSTIAKLP